MKNYYYYDATPENLIKTTVFSEKNENELFLPILHSYSPKSSIYENLLLNKSYSDIVENIKYVNYEDHKFTWDIVNETKERRINILEVFRSLNQYKIELEFLYPQKTTNYKYVKDTFFTKIVNYLFSNKNVLSTLMFFKRIDDIVLVEIILFCTSSLNIEELDANMYNGVRVNCRITPIEDEKLREQYWFFKLHKEIFLNTSICTDSSFIIPFVCKNDSGLLQEIQKVLPYKSPNELYQWWDFFEGPLTDWLSEWLGLTWDEEDMDKHFSFIPNIIGRRAYQLVERKEKISNLIPIGCN